MPLNRREFITLMGGSAGAAVLFQACGLPEKELLIDSPIEMPEDMVTGIDNWYATVSHQWPASEGIVVRVMEGRAKKVEGNIDYPLNQGRHSVRSEAAVQGLYHPDRISAPMVRTGPRGSGEFSEISWEDAIGRLTHQLGELESSGQQDRAVFVTDPVNAHLGLVLDKFAQATGVRRLVYEPIEHTVLARAIKDVFGQELIPDFDIENSDYVLSFGADFLNTWVSPVRYSKSYGEFRQGHEHRGKLVHVDSRFSMTAANADKWIPITPGMEGIFALSIAQVIATSPDANRDIVNSLTGGDPNWLDTYEPEAVSARIGVSSEDIRLVAKEFQSSQRPLAIGGGSASAHTNGLPNLKAIYSLNHFASNIGKEGGIKFNPNSPLEDVPNYGSGNSFVDFHRLSEDMIAGEVSLLMIRGADPYYGMPDFTRFKEAVLNVPFIFSFSGLMDDTTSMSDLILPEHHFLEDWGTDIPFAGPGYQMVGFQQPVVRPFFGNRGRNLGTKGFSDILLTSAQVLGKDLGLPGGTFREMMRDSARKLYALNRGSVSAPTFELFWNGLLQRGGWWDTNAQGDESVVIKRLDGVPFPQYKGAGQFSLQPFTLASLSDGRNAHLPWLQAMPDPVSSATWQTWVEINHKVAEERGIKEGDVLMIKASNGGSIRALAMPNPATHPDVLSVPIGQGHRDGGRYASGRGSNVLSILESATDDDTGALAWAASRVEIELTGEWVRVPKFENTVPEFPRDEHDHIIEVTTGEHLDGTTNRK